METMSMVLLKSAAWLTAFAVIFLLALRNERFFRLNRFYLLAGIIASLLFPFYTFHYSVVMPAVTIASASAGDLSIETIVPEGTSIPILYWVYIAGAALFLLRMLFQSFKIILKLRRTGYELAGEVKVVRASDFASPFSFFSFVFVNPSVSPIEMEEIIHHEREHIQQRHWFDLLLVEFVCIVQWFNPFVWVYAHLVRQNHEYLADERALQSTADPAVYQAALLNQLMGEPVFSLTNSFSYSLNKKRFAMMKKTIDSPLRKLKMLVILPMAAMLFYAFALPEYQYGNDSGILQQETKTVNIQGQVVKADGSPLQGTSVILRSSTIGTMTDSEGKFELKGIPEDGEIFFTFVGFKTVVQKVSTQPMKIVMEVANVGIEKIVVVAYATPPPPPPPPPAGKEKINEMLVMGKGKDAPLVILDGKEIPSGDMDKISPDQIESISVLKDKSATIMFGDKGKNGVILITSKGKAGKDKNAKTGNEEVVVVGYGKNQSAGQSSASMVKIRTIDSDNPPLVLLDGEEISHKQMEQINSDQIESMNVLKDKSSTAVYGEKGKNGVILITSKAKTRTDKEAISGTPGKKNEQSKTNAKGEKEVFVVVEEMPEYPGGSSALRDFIAREIRYPMEARTGKIQGKVFVSFVVSSTGKVEEAMVVKSVNPLLDAEALRVVNRMPDWKPARQRGQAVSVAYTLPIEFILQ
jgi:TonB family protein